MTTTTHEHRAAQSRLFVPEQPPEVPAWLHVTIEPAGAVLFRVRERAGSIIGHLEAVDDPRGRTWRALRFHPLRRAFGGLGEFWSPGDAVIALQGG